MRARPGSEPFRALDDSSFRAPHSATIRGRREPGRSSEGRREMTLRREARGGGDLRQRSIGAVDQRAGALDSTLLDERARGGARRGPERPPEVMDAESGASGEIANVDRTIDVRLDEHLHAPQGGWRQAAALMALPRRGRLVEPLAKVGDVPLLDVPRGSKHAAPSARVLLARTPRASPRHGAAAAPRCDRSTRARAASVRSVVRQAPAERRA